MPSNNAIARGHRMSDTRNSYGDLFEWILYRYGCFREPTHLRSRYLPTPHIHSCVATSPDFARRAAWQSHSLPDLSSEGRRGATVQTKSPSRPN